MNLYYVICMTHSITTSLRKDYTIVKIENYNDIICYRSLLTHMSESEYLSYVKVFLKKGGTYCFSLNNFIIDIDFPHDNDYLICTKNDYLR